MPFFTRKVSILELKIRFKMLSSGYSSHLEALRASHHLQIDKPTNSRVFFRQQSFSNWLIPSTTVTFFFFLQLWHNNKITLLHIVLFKT